MKKIVLLLMALLLAIGASACGATSTTGTNENSTVASNTQTSTTETSTTSGEKIKIGFSQCVMNHPFRISMVNTFKEAAKGYADVEPIVVEGNGDVQTEITNIESLIEQGCKAIIVSSLSGKSIYPAYKEVFDAGIPLIIAASGNASEDEDAYNYYKTFVSTDEIQMGMAAADNANKLLNGKGNVVMIRGVVESTNSMNRFVGWNNQITKYPELKVISTQSAEWIRLKANEVMANILQANSKIDLVYSENDEMALGALEAIRDAGREKEIKIISMDGQKDAAEEIAKNGAFKLTITNVSDTAEALKAAYTLAKGGNVEKRIILPFEQVMPENVADYIAKNF